MIFGKHGLGRPILGDRNEYSSHEAPRSAGVFPKALSTGANGYFGFRKYLARNRSQEVSQIARNQLARSRSRERVGTSRKDFGFQPAPKMRDGPWWIKRATEQVHLVWGVEGVNYSSKDRFAAYLLNLYLGGGMSSQLFQEIREKNGLAYTVYSNLSSFVDSGVFSVYAATGMNQVPLCLKLIEECAEKLKREPLSEKDLQGVKDNLKGTILLNSDSVEARCPRWRRIRCFWGRSSPSKKSAR